MPISLSFSATHRYRDQAPAVELPVVLRAGGNSVDVRARVDTGAANCIFERRFAELLGLDVESGRLQAFRTVTGPFSTYEHEVVIHSLGIEFSSVVYFAQDRTFNRSVLGRTGWLDRVRVAIVDYDRTIHLSAYDD
jgi:hypothetical protein